MTKSEKIKTIKTCLDDGNPSIHTRLNHGRLWNYLVFNDDLYLVFKDEKYDESEEIVKDLKSYPKFTIHASKPESSHRYNEFDATINGEAKFVNDSSLIKEFLKSKPDIAKYYDIYKYKFFFAKVEKLEAKIQRIIKEETKFDW